MGGSYPLVIVLVNDCIKKNLDLLTNCVSSPLCVIINSFRCEILVLENGDKMGNSFNW